MAYSYPDTEEFLDAGEFIKETCEIFKTQGVKGLIKHVTHNLNYKWKHAKIKVAVTGDSGAGISSLINALRGMHQCDQNAAKEGVKGTTKERGLYTFPDNDQIELYDLPGIGTLSHPIESYMQDMNFEKYDFILIVSSGRISQNNALIIKELQNLKKPFYLVRSKIFADVDNQKFTQTKDEVLKIIRDDCYLNLQKLGVEAKCVFLIDSHVHQDFELGKLQATLIRDVRDTFKTTLMLTYRTMMKQIIEEKVKALKSRAYKVALMTAVTAVPEANEFVFIQEISFYKKQLGLDDESLGETCKYLEIDRARLQEMIAFCDFVVFPEKTIEYINNFKKMLDNAPFSLTNLLFGTPASGLVGTEVCRGLFIVIDTLEKDSLKISENVLEKIRGSSFV